MICVISIWIYPSRTEEATSESVSACGKRKPCNSELDTDRLARAETVTDDDDDDISDLLTP